MWITDQPATDYPTSVNPSPKERPTKKDTKKIGRKSDRGHNGPRLCGNCGGTGRIVEPDNSIWYCPTCNGEGIG